MRRLGRGFKWSQWPLRATRSIFRHNKLERQAPLQRQGCSLSEHGLRAPSSIAWSQRAPSDQDGCCAWSNSASTVGVPNSARAIRMKSRRWFSTDRDALSSACSCSSVHSRPRTTVANLLRATPDCVAVLTISAHASMSLVAVRTAVGEPMTSIFDQAWFMGSNPSANQSWRASGSNGARILSTTSRPSPSPERVRIASRNVLARIVNDSECAIIW